MCLYMLYDQKRSHSNLSYTQNNDCNKHPWENSPDVIGAETFFKMEQRGFCTYGQCIVKCRWNLLKNKND